jgi:hypothetical protein
MKEKFAYPSEILFVFVLAVIALWLAISPLFHQQPKTVFHYQAQPEDTVKSTFNKRIGKINYTIELAWVAKTQDGQVYIERIR